MVTTRSKARLLEQATNNSGSNQQNTESTLNSTLANQDPVDAAIYRGAARGAADSDDSTHGKDAESNGALMPQNPIENEPPLTGSNSADTSKADAITRNDSHAQDQSVIPATFGIDVSGQRASVSNDQEVLSDATNKVASTSNTNKAKKQTRSRARRGRKPTSRGGKKRLAAAKEQAPQVENDSLPTPLDNSANTLTIPSVRDDAPRGCKGKDRMVVSPESFEKGALGKSDKQTDAVDALLQLQSSRSPTQSRSDRSSGTGASRSAEEDSVPPRRSYRLGVKRELKEKREKEKQELEQQEKERREREKQEKAKEKAKETRNTGDKAAKSSASRPAANVNNRKRRVADVADVEDVEDASKEIGPQRKKTAFSRPEKARSKTDRPTQDRCSPSSCSGPSFGSADALELSDAPETVSASESIDIPRTINASRLMETFEPFDVKRRIRCYMQVSEARSTLRESEYEDPLDEDDASSPVPIFRRIRPPPSEVGYPSQPYYLTRLLSLQLGNIWRPET